MRCWRRRPRSVSRRRWATTRPCRQAHRLHQGRAGTAARAELRLHREERQPDQRVVGQDLQGLTAPRRTVAGALLGPATVAVVLGLLVPLAILFRYSFNRFVPGRLMVEAVTVDNYVKFFTDPYYVAILVRTLRVSAVCMVLCLVMGFPLAYALARTQSRWKSALVMLVVLPLFVGNAVRAAGWMVLFGKQGFLNASLDFLGLLAQPLEIMYTPTAVVVGITAVNLPFMVLTLQSVLEGVDA